jgi:hypothetical protein
MSVIAMLRQLTFSEYDPSCGVILNSSGQVNGEVVNKNACASLQ